MRASRPRCVYPPRAQQQGLLGSLLSALQEREVGVDFLQRQLGLPSLSPQQRGPDEYVWLANYARRHDPDVMEEQVRELPWFVKAMGHQAASWVAPATLSSALGCLVPCWGADHAWCFFSYGHLEFLPQHFYAKILLSALS